MSPAKERLIVVYRLVASYVAAMPEAFSEFDGEPGTCVEMIRRIVSWRRNLVDAGQYKMVDAIDVLMEWVFE